MSKAKCAEGRISLRVKDNVSRKYGRKNSNKGSKVLFDQALPEVLSPVAKKQYVSHNDTNKQ